VFSFFKSRLKRNLMIVVSAILIIHYIFIMSMYFVVIEKDFLYKVEHFNKQHISNIESKMIEIENQVQMFEKKYNSALLSTSRKNQIVTALRKVKNYTFGIRDAFICGVNADYYDQKVSDFTSENAFREKYLNKNISGWTSYKTGGGQVLVLYVREIENTDNKIFVNVDTSIFNFWDQDNLFYDIYMTDISFIADNTHITTGKGADYYTVDYQKTSNLDTDVYENIISSGIKVSSHLSKSRIENKFYSYYLLTVGIMILFLVMAWIVLSYLTNRIEGICSNVFYKVRNFTYEIKDGDSDA